MNAVGDIRAREPQPRPADAHWTHHDPGTQDIIAAAVAKAKAEALHDAATDLTRCLEAGWSAAQIVTALHNRAQEAGQP